MPGDAARDGVRGEMIADRYQLLTRLGRGGMGEVWAGRDLRLHRDVAVKLFRGDAAAPGGLPDWLRREGIAAAQINHPNVAVLYDQGAHKGRIYLVMELVAGPTLDDIMRSGSLPVRDAVRFAGQICEALAAAHAAQVVHRDIKPQNVLVTPDGLVKVVDFGIAGFLNDTRSWTVARFDDAVKGSGTPEYAAPEQVTGHNADARSDLYSLGTLLFAMLAGRVPFSAPSFLAVMHRKVTEDAPTLGSVKPGLPIALVGLVESLLAREPGDRPRSAREVAEQLRVIAAHLAGGGAGGGGGGGGGGAEAGADRVAAPASESIKLQPRPKVEGSGQGAEDKSPWTPEPKPVPSKAAPEVRPKPSSSTPTRSADASADKPAVKPPAMVEGSPQKKPASKPEPAPVPVPVPKPPDPLAATGATMLSPVASVELRGRSLLPAAPRSLLREPGASPHIAQSGAQPPAPPDHETRRQLLTWTLLSLLFLVATVAVTLAVTLK